MSSHDIWTTPVFDGQRRHTRLALCGRLPVHDITADVVMEVIDLSWGGMRTRSDIALAVGPLHAFSVRVADLEPMTVIATLIRCQVPAENRTGYELGWRWAREVQTTRAAERLLEHFGTDSVAHRNLRTHASVVH